MATVLSYTYKFLILLFIISKSVVGQDTLQLVTALPSQMNEISGITNAKNGQVFAINDGDNPKSIYLLNLEGKIVKKIKVDNAHNKDWEAITKDNHGFVYVADLGNNKNGREGLVIYKILESDIYKNDLVFASAIEINYKDQKKFPPSHKKMNYDAESLIWYNNKLYIFTKNRTKPFTGYTYVYEVNIRSGKQDARKVDSIYTGNEKLSSWVTDAAISKDQRHLVLLNHGKIILISDFYGHHFSSGYKQIIPLNHITQKEGICFNTDSTILISDERVGIIGGNLYTLNLKKNIAFIDSIRRNEVEIPETTFVDSLLINLNLKVAGDVYYEFFNRSMNRVDYGKIGFLTKGNHSVFIKPNQMINSRYMLNIRVGTRPHGFFVRRFKDKVWLEEPDSNAQD